MPPPLIAPLRAIPRPLAARAALAWEIARAPRARIELAGSDVARRAYEDFTSRHPRYRAFRRKAWGVALVALPDTMEAYLQGSSRLVRRKRRAATAKGFTYATFAAQHHVGEILAINRSAPVRQGQAMDADYTSEAAVQAFARAAGGLAGVFDAAGALRAYAYVPVLGDAAVFHRLLGHADDLADGIMWLLVSEVIADMIGRRAHDGRLRWVMYDTLWGAQDGMAHFKRRLGFEPYRVDWVWAGD